MARKKKTAAEAPPPEIATAIAEANPAEAPERDRRFRSWVTDRANGYERLTDEKGRQIVLKFAEQPSEGIRAKLKEAGFRFQPEYFGERKVWTRRNDFEGKLQVEQLEAAIRGSAREQEPAS
jgi:hypothetical protein